MHRLNLRSATVLASVMMQSAFALAVLASPARATSPPFTDRAEWTEAAGTTTGDAHESKHEHDGPVS